MLLLTSYLLIAHYKFLSRETPGSFGPRVTITNHAMGGGQSPQDMPCPLVKASRTALQAYFTILIYIVTQVILANDNTFQQLLHHHFKVTDILPSLFSLKKK